MKGKVLYFIVILFFSMGCIRSFDLYRRPLKKSWFYDRMLIDFGLRNPELLSYSGLPYFSFFNDYRSRLRPVGDAARREEIKQLSRELSILGTYKKGEDFRERQSREILKWFFEKEVRDSAFLYNFPAIDHYYGYHLQTLEFLTDVHSLDRIDDFEAFNERLKDYAENLVRLSLDIKTRRERGYHYPCMVLEKTTDQFQSLVKRLPDNSKLYLHFYRTLERQNWMRKKKKEELNERCLLLLEGKVKNAYQKVLNELLKGKQFCSGEAGVWAMPRGREFYKHVLWKETTMRIDPDSLFKTGLQEVKRIGVEMKNIGYQLGVDSSQNIGAMIDSLVLKLLSTDRVEDEDDKALMQRIRELVQKAEKQSREYFHPLRSRLRIKKVSESKSATVSGAYYMPPGLGGNRPGSFYVNIEVLKHQPSWTLPTLVWHESIPGHHFQVSWQINKSKGPLFKKVLPIPAFVEGWALYAERLAWELGFSTDPAVNLGRLQSEIIRAVRLVVDVGMHYLKWDYAKAKAYMIKNTGLPEKEVETELLRYMVNPGQACAYKVGELWILSLRDQCRKALGEQFSLKEFHRWILEDGAMTLPALREKIAFNLEEIRNTRK